MMQYQNRLQRALQDAVDRKTELRQILEDEDLLPAEEVLLMKHDYWREHGRILGLEEALTTFYSVGEENGWWALM